MRDREFEKREMERERAALDAEADRREALAADRRDRLAFLVDELPVIESHFDVDRAAMEERIK